MTLKRDNWTNEEVIKLIEGCRPIMRTNNHSPIENAWHDGRKVGLDQAIKRFQEFSEGTVSYDTETGREVHIGGV